MGLPADARRALRDAFGEPDETPAKPKAPGQLLREAEQRARQLRRGRKAEPAAPPAPNGVKMLEWVRTGLELGIIPEAALRAKLRELFSESVAPAPPASPAAPE